MDIYNEKDFILSPKIYYKNVTEEDGTRVIIVCVKTEIVYK